jgi:hypothetical protein
MAFNRRGFLKGLGAAVAAIVPLSTAKMSADAFEATAGTINPDLEEVDLKHLTLNKSGEFVWDEGIDYSQFACSGVIWQTGVANVPPSGTVDRLRGAQDEN